MNTPLSLRAWPSRGLNGNVEVPGDKSISHRALIIGAMALGRTRIQGLLESDDVRRTLAAVRLLGASVEQRGPVVEVEGVEWRSPRGRIDCGNAGTCVRLLLGAASGYPLQATFSGDESLSRRPMERIASPLRQMGASISGGPGLPMTVRGGNLRGIRFVNSSASAQVKSAILLAGLNSEGAVEIIEPRPSRDHSERMLRAMGVDVDVGSGPEGRIIQLGTRRQLISGEVQVAGDPSSAAFPIVAALLTSQSAVRIRGLVANPLRNGLFDTLREMGANMCEEGRRVVGGEEVIDLIACSSGLRGIDVPAGRAPSMIDEYPILAVAAACAEGITSMHGLAELRVKESDRLGAILAGLRACGVEAAIEGDALLVEGRGEPPPGGALVETHGDHRIAMAFLILGHCSQHPVVVDRAEMIGTSFPGFADLMRQLGAKLEAA